MNNPNDPANTRTQTSDGGSGMSISGQAEEGSAPGEGIANITRLNATGRGTGEESILSAETDADGWYTGVVPKFSKTIGVRKVLGGAIEGDWWQARVGQMERPHKYLNKYIALQGALAEVQRMRIAGED